MCQFLSPSRSSTLYLFFLISLFFSVCATFLCGTVTILTKDTLMSCLLDYVATHSKVRKINVHPFPIQSVIKIRGKKTHLVCILEYLTKSGWCWHKMYSKSSNENNCLWILMSAYWMADTMLGSLPPLSSHKSLCISSSSLNLIVKLSY